MKSSVRNNDPRETLAHQLAEAGLNSKDAFIIALDSGLNVVDRDYLIDLGLKGNQLILAETCIKDFYWEYGWGAYESWTPQMGFWEIRQSEMAIIFGSRTPIYVRLVNRVLVTSFDSWKCLDEYWFDWRILKDKYCLDDVVLSFALGHRWGRNKGAHKILQLIDLETAVN